MKILLLFPPQWDPFQPYLSLPSLTAFLEKSGYEVIQKDLNIEAYDTLLTERRLEGAFENLSEKFMKLKNKKKLSSKEESQYKMLSKVILSAPYIIKEIENSKRILRDKDGFYDFDKYSRSIEIIKKGLDLLSVEYYPSRLTLESYATKYSLSSSKELLEAIYDEEENMFLDFFKNQTLPFIAHMKPGLVGISISGYSQTIPGFNLAKLIKEEMPQVHITVGGKIITWLLADRLQNVKELFSIVDSFIVYEGEHALLKLAEQVKEKADFKSVPNLVYYEKGEIHFSNQIFAEDINSLPTPCFNGLPLELYLSPEPILSVQPARGCYWKRCAFCETSQNYSGYQVRSTRLLIEDIKYLSRKYNAKNFAFANEALSPKILGNISSSIICNNLNVTWYCSARFEKRLTSALCRKIAKAGCKKILFGLESGCQRILDLMEKETKKEIIEKILRYCYKEGIAVHLFCLIGFPTETQEESLETLDFILKNKDILNCHNFSYCISSFQLKRHTKVKKFPGRYGIEIFPNKDQDLGFMDGYKVKYGMSMEETKEIKLLIDKKLAEIFENNFPSFFPHNFLYLSRLSERTFSTSKRTKYITRKSIQSFIDQGGETMHINRPSKREDIIYRRIGEEAILYSTETKSIHVINLTAATIWELCDGSHDLSQIEEKIKEEFELSEGDKLHHDIQEIINAFKNLMLLNKDG